MLTRTRETQVDKARRTVREVARYAQEVARDERLRSDVSAALAHGSKAGSRLKKDVEAGDGIYERLATDKKLRKSLSAMLDDIDSAGERLRRKKSHRVRNVLLVVGAAAVAAATLSKIWSRFSSSTSEPEPVV